MTPKSNAMLDLETLGTKPGCVILSIASVPFAMPYDLEPFYVKISASSCSAVGLSISEATQAWWGRRSDAARDEAFSGTTDIKVALTEYAEYLHSMPTAPKIWGNGSDFDNPILAAAYEICGIPVPWSFRDNMCYRTLKNMFPTLAIIKPTIAHNALEDAKAQAANANRIFNWINGRTLPEVPDAQNS